MTVEHGTLTPADSPTSTRGNHTVEGFPSVADEAARAAIVQVATDRGREVYQSAGTTPGWYRADGAGGWLHLGNVGAPPAPATHAASHENGGGDEVSVAGLSGLLADDQNPTAHSGDHENGGGDEISVAGLSGALADDQVPTTHSITAKHNGFPGGGTTFLRDDGTFATPAAGTGDVVGPAGATSGAVARFDTATGKLLKDSKTSVSDVGKLTVEADALQTVMAILSGANAGGSVSEQIRNGAAAAVANVVQTDYRLLTDLQERTAIRLAAKLTDIADATRSAQLDITALDSGNFASRVTLKGRDLSIGGVTPVERLTVSDEGNDTVPPLSVATTGTNGAKVRIFSGTRNPNGLVTGAPGDLYVQKIGATSTTWQNINAASGTTWKSLSSPLETAGGGIPVQPHNQNDLSVFRVTNDDDFHGAIYYIPHDITFNQLNFRRTTSVAGTIRFAFYQAADATVLDGNMDLVVAQDIVWSGTGVIAQALAGTEILRAGYYALLYGRTANGSFYIDCHNTAQFYMFNTTMPASTYPTEFTTTIPSSSAAPATFDPFTQATASDTIRCTPIHRLKTV